MVTTSFFEGALLLGMGANRARASNCTAQRRTKRITTNKGDISQPCRKTLTPCFMNQASHVRTNKQTSSKNKHPKVAKVKWATQLGIRHKFGTRIVSSPSGWLFKPVQEELGENQTRQLDPSHNPRSKLEFVSTPPHQVIHQPQLDSKKAQALSSKVNKLSQKRAIVPTIKDGAGFVSPVFVVPKAGGQRHLVINFKALNYYVIVPHFKMESIRTVQYLIQKDDWLTKLNLKDAYLSVPVNPCYQKCLKFCWLDQLWQFTVLPFGLNCAPYIFTKLMKPIVVTLRRLGIWMILNLDDMILMANSQEKAREHLQCAANLLTSLRFMLKLDKSVISLSQHIEFLGFDLNSNTMMIFLPSQKLTSLVKSV